MVEGVVVPQASLGASKERNSPSRLRFRPPPSNAFGFRLRHRPGASPYSRPVLGATPMLPQHAASVKQRLPAISDFRRGSYARETCYLRKGLVRPKAARAASTASSDGLLRLSATRSRSASPARRARQPTLLPSHRPLRAGGSREPRAALRCSRVSPPARCVRAQRSSPWPVGSAEPRLALAHRLPLRGLLPQESWRSEDRGCARRLGCSRPSRPQPTPGERRALPWSCRLRCLVDVGRIVFMLSDGTSVTVRDRHPIELNAAQGDVLRQAVASFADPA
jgi:hypothetical protein